MAESNGDTRQKNSLAIVSLLLAALALTVSIASFCLAYAIEQSWSETRIFARVRVVNRASSSGREDKISVALFNDALRGDARIFGVALSSDDPPIQLTLDPVERDPDVPQVIGPGGFMRWVSRSDDDGSDWSNTLRQLRTESGNKKSEFTMSLAIQTDPGKTPVRHPLTLKLKELGASDEDRWEADFQLVE